MGTKSFRLSLIIILLFYSIRADYYHRINANRQHITLNGLFTYSHYPSLQFALEQVNSDLLLSETNIEFHLNKTEGILQVNFSKNQKFFFLKFLF